MQRSKYKVSDKAYWQAVSQASSGYSWWTRELDYKCFLFILEAAFWRRSNFEWHSWNFPPCVPLLLIGHVLFWFSKVPLKINEGQKNQFLPLFLYAIYVENIDGIPRPKGISQI